jgi:zinc transport system substrate-binding protein
MGVNRHRIAAAALAALLLLCMAGCGAKREHAARTDRDGKVHIVVTTTLLASAVRQVGGDSVSVRVIMPPGSCPGHFDISPKETKAIAGSTAVFTHGYEAFVPGMLRSLGNDAPRLMTIKADGNWLVPSVYVQGARQITRALCSIDPPHSASYRKSLAALEAECHSLEAKLKRRLAAAHVSSVTALCADQQFPVAEWMGLDVIGGYPRAEQFTPEMLHGLTKLARTKHIRLIIDNLQSGPDAGKQLAADIGAAHATLSNFPGGFAGTDTWSKCLTDNVNRVVEEIGSR